MLTSKLGKNPRGLGSSFGQVFESVAESAAASIAVNQAASAVESFAANPSIPTPFIPIPRGLGSDFGQVFESVAESAAASIAVHQAASVIGSFIDPPATTPGSAAVPTPVIDSLIPSKFLLIYEEDFANPQIQGLPSLIRSFRPPLCPLCRPL